MARYCVNWRHHDAPDYVNQFRAIADSDFIPHLIASLHLQVPRHLTTLKLMIEKEDNFWIGWRHQIGWRELAKYRVTLSGPRVIHLPGCLRMGRFLHMLVVISLLTSESPVLHTQPLWCDYTTKHQ